MPETPTRPLEDRPAVLLRAAWANILDGCYHSADQQLNELAWLFDSAAVLARYNNPEIFSKVAGEIAVVIEKFESQDSLIYLWVGEVAGDIMEGKVLVLEAMVDFTACFDFERALAECSMKWFEHLCVSFPRGAKRSIYAYEKKVAEYRNCQEWGDIRELVVLAAKCINELSKAIAAEPRIWLNDQGEKRKVVIGSGFGFPFVRER